MGSPIDPVTGLPMVGVPDVISQIPLGKQVVPFEDLDAISRPQQGPAYPNDILNTLAYVTGESLVHPGSMRAGTMTEDRRLRVDATVSGGAGGIVPSGIVMGNFFGNTSIGAGTASTANISDVCTKVYGVQISWVATQLQAGGVSGWLQFFLQDPVIGNAAFVFSQSIFTATVLTDPPPMNALSIQFMPVIDCAAMGWQVAANFLVLAVTNNSFYDIDVSGVVFTDGHF